MPSTSGSYYLTTDVTLTDTWVVSGDVKLCLNGCTITGADGKDVIKVVSGGSLAITDCQTDDDAGSITHNEGASGRGIENCGTLALWNGNIAGNTAMGGVSAIGSGGGVLNEGTFAMYGGVISDSLGWYGGGVRNDGTFNMAGGSITDNKAERQGGGVYNNGTLNVSGEADVSNNELSDADDDTENNVYLPSGKTVAVEEGKSLSGGDSSVGITVSNPQPGLTVVTGTTRTTGFSSDDSSYGLADNGDGGLKLVALHKHAICGKTGCGDEGHSTITWVAWESTDSLPSQTGYYYLVNDVTLSSSWDVNTEITLCLNGKTITGANGNDVISISEGGDLRVTDCQETAGKITHKSGETGRGVSNFGTFTLWNGTITGNAATDQGGGLYNTGTFKMVGGSIAKNSAGIQGGGLYNTGTFKMVGGSIAKNSAGIQGGGIFTNGTVNMTGGEISQNSALKQEGYSASGIGGGVYTYLGTFTMSGGSITGNTSDSEAGGVYYGSGTFNLSGDVTISGNTAADAANNACLAYGQSITVEQGKSVSATSKVGITAANQDSSPTVVTGTSSVDGFFSDSASYAVVGDTDEGVLKLATKTHAASHKICGEVGCDDSSHGDELTWTSISSLSEIAADGNYVLTSDVTLSDTWTCSYDVNLCLSGHVVYGANGKDVILVASGKSLAITDCYSGESVGKITHKGGETGRGIENKGTFTLWNGSICGNTADDNGVAVYNGGEFNMRGGSIANNTMVNSHYGIVCNRGTLNMSGGSITNNTGVQGSGVNNCSGATFNMSGGSITGNKTDSQYTYSGGGVFNSGTFKVSGAVNITGNINKVGAANVYLDAGCITVNDADALDSTSRVGISVNSIEATPYGVKGSTDTNVFTSDNSAYVLAVDGNDLKWEQPHRHYICGSESCDDGHAYLTFTGVSKLSDITGDGNYYLTDNVILDSTWECTNNVNLCLNGKNITGPAGSEAIKVAVGANLAITDCNESAGQINHQADAAGRGVTNDGTLTLWKGYVFGNAADETTGYVGGGVYNSGTFTMNGGSVAANAANYGAGVYNDGTFNLVSGDFYYNDATYYGGGIYNEGELAVSGGKVYENTAVSYGGGVYNDGSFELSGKVYISSNYVGEDDQSYENVCLNGGVITVDGNLDASSRVGLAAAKPGNGVQAVTGSTNTTVFTSDDDAYDLVENSEKTGLNFSAKKATISGVKLLNSVADEDADKADHAGEEMGGDPKSKVYDNRAVAYDAESATVSQAITGAELVYTWQKKNGDDYADIADNEAPKAAGEYRLLVTYVRDGVVFGTTEIPFSITKRRITVLNFNVGDRKSDDEYSDKTYDGTTSVKIGGFEVGNVADGEGKNLVVTLSEAKFDDKNVGSNKTVTAKVALTGSSASNYTFDPVATDTAAIIPKALSITAYVGDKPYDGTAEATVDNISIGGSISGDKVALDQSKMAATFDSAEVGDDKTVTITGLALSGDDAGNYTLPEKVTATAGITKGNGAGTVALDGWTYGDAAKTPVPVSDTNGTDNVTYLYKVKGATDDTYAEAAPTAAGDYTVKATFPATVNYEAVTATADFTIAPKVLTIAGLAVAEKTYDGTTAATIEGAPTLEGVVAGDDVSLVNGTPTFSSKTVGKNIPVSFTAFSLSGKAAANYTLTQPVDVTGTIVAKELTITGATVAEKAYDGTDAATVTGVSFDGLVAGESLAFGADYTVTGAAYDGVNATGDGAATKVDFSVTLKATSVGRNYVLKDAKGSQAATIKKVETQGYTPVIAGKAGEQGSCQVYIVPGGSVQVSCLDALGIIDGEPTFANGTLTYKLKDSATEGQTAVLRVRVKSANYEEYAVLVTVEVAAKEQVDIDLRGDEFTYNGQAQAPAIAVEGNKLEASDLDVTYYDAMGEKLDAAPSKAGVYLMEVNVPDSNTSYTGFAFCTFQIAAKPLTATLKAQDKTYDGNALATAAVDLSGVVDGDKVSADVAFAFFADKSVGGEKTVRAAVVLSGEDAANYTLAETAEAKASITAKELGVTAVAADKTYDGRADANATATLDGVVPGDDVTATVTSASFADKNAGSGKDVTVGVALEGADKGNYTVSSTVKATASIAARQLTIVGVTVAPKAYDGTAAATVTGVSFDGLLAGESLAFGTDYGVTGASYDGANATGDGAATKVGFSVTLADTAAAKNYTLVSAEGEQAATIAKVETSGYAISVEGKRGKQGDCWVYVVPGGEAAVSIESDANGILADAPTFANGTLAYSLKGSAAEGQTATVKVKVTSANYADYEVSITIGVTEKEQVEIDLTGEEFTYNGHAQSPAVAVEGNKLEVNDLDVTYYDAAGEELEKAPTKAGTYLMVVAVPDNNASYTGFAACTFEIAKKAVSVKDLSIAPKFYDGTTRATIGSRPAIDGAVKGDDVALVNGVPTFTSAAVGESVPVRFTDFSLTGGAASNYELTQPTGVTGIISAYSAYGFEYRATTVEWTNQDFVVTAADGWKVCLANTADGDWKDSLTCSADGAGSLTFFVRNTEFGYISQAVSLDYHIDKTAPAGKIEIGKDFWTEFLETATFGLYRNDKQVVTITGTDALSGVAKVEYLVTAEDLTIDQLAGRELAVYSGAFDIEPDTSAIVYARVTDVAGNVSYLRSDGVVLDATAPVILYVEDGRTYCGAADMKVVEANLDAVTVNGAAVELDEGWLTVGPAEGEQVVVVTDKAGNSATVKFTVNDGHTWGEWVSNGDGTHTRTCKHNALHAQKAYCHGGEATCSGRAVCDDCGQEYGEVDPGNHAALTHVAAKEATTESEGNIEYWYCESCGKYFADAAGEQEISWADTVIAKKDEDKKDDKKDDSADKDDKSGNKTDDEKTDNGEPKKPESADKSDPKPADRPKVPEAGDATATAWLPALLGTAALTTALVSARKRRDK